MEFNSENLADLIIERLKPLNPLKIILFGSYGYGTPNTDSDLDICVIKKDITSKSEEKKEIRSRLKGISIAKDILLVGEQEYDFYKNQYGSVYMDIERKGKVLWTSL
jgi:predicted nucleotidyltransferase